MMLSCLPVAGVEVGAAVEAAGLRPPRLKPVEEVVVAAAPPNVRPPLGLAIALPGQHREQNLDPVSLVFRVK
jgi:hypothetical protein